MTIARKILFTLSTLYLVGCADDLPPRAPNFVVEAFITAGESVDNIKIKGTSPIDSADVTNTPIGNANVTISNDAQEFSLEYNALTGLYEVPGQDLEIISGNSYTLNVAVGEREATAQTVVPSPPLNVRLADSVLAIPTLTLNFGLRQQIPDLFNSERITLRWDSIPGQRYFVVIENRADEITPILPDGIPPESQELISSFKFISEPSETASFDIIGVALDTYGPHIAKVFTVNEEYADLFDNLEQDSRDLNEPPSNVLNAQGIFTAFAVDSVAFEVIVR